MKKQHLVTLIRVAALIALQIILERFLSVNTPIMRIGLGFVPLALCGILYGPVWTGAAAGIGDVLGTFLTPYGLYPPITLTAILTGFSLGLFLRRQNGRNVKFFPNVLLCAIVNAVGLSLFLQSFWLSLLQHVPYLSMVATRLIQCLILTTLYIILIPLLQKLAPKLEHLS